MITVFLRGGLGNQMFQYALGLSLAKHHHADLVFDTVFLNDRFPRKQFTYRTFDLDIFALTPQFTNLSKISQAVPIPGVWLGMDLALINIRDALGTQKLLKEKKDYSFDPDVLRASSNVVLWGFWRTARYFEGMEKELRSAFIFKHPLIGEALEISRDIQGSNSVSLHVRRTDYLLPKYRSTYGETDLSYYERAIQRVAQEVRDPKFFIFSDDIAWCRDHLKIPFPARFIDRSSEGPKASFHLQLMSLCKNNIIPNSSFSWWGAWLNKNPQKIVIAPARWEMDTEAPDAVPSGWVRL